MAIGTNIRRFNGIAYTVTDIDGRNIRRFDGGARGGYFERYPSGMFRGYDKWLHSFEEMAELAQAKQRERYDAACVFIDKYMKEFG